MAEADPDSSDTSDAVVDLKPISSAPLFSIPRFFVSKDSDAAGRSPTSPLDFTLFGGLFSPRTPAAPSSPRFAHRTKWACDKVGLSLLSGEEGHESLFNNIVLAPQIKPRLFGSCVKSYSLPKNYAAPSMSSDAVNIHALPCDDATAGVCDSEEHNSPRRSSSSPMDIISSHSSLSAREMALSEDYTCIISHGPNPKTIHIFGDCILDCDPNELGTKDETEKPEGDDSLVCLCTDKTQNHIHMHSEASSAAAAAAGKENDKGGDEDCVEISPGSSYNEGLFPMAS